MRAHNYIRNVAAHGLDDRRKDEHGNTIGGHRAEFEAVMNFSNSISGVTFDADFVTVNPGTLFADIKNVLYSIAQQATAHSAQYHS